MITKTGIFYASGTCPEMNLALEEYLLFHTESGECLLYLWQNERTVVVGRNQNCWKECDVSRLKEEGGHLVRRLSGGGAVYHDLGNLNFTFLVRKEDYDLERQLLVIKKAVESFGVPVEKHGVNGHLRQKGKIAELQKQLRELEAAKTEQENLQIVQLVRGLNMTPEEFAAFVRSGALQAPPAPQPDFEQEDNADEE